MKKKVLIGCGIIAGLMFCGFAMLAILGTIAFRHIHKVSTKLPAQLSKPAILQGKSFLTKSTFCKCPVTDMVTDMVIGDYDPTPGLEMRIAGLCGAELVAGDGRKLNSVSFDSSCSYVDIVDVEGDGVPEYLNRGSWEVDASLLDHDGNVVWSYGGSPGVDDACSGDIDGDGNLEYAVGFNGDGGIRLLETDGKLKWKRPGGNVWHVEMFDVNNDGKLEVVHSGESYKLSALDRAGNEVPMLNSSVQALFDSRQLKDFRPTLDFYDFFTCKWPTSSSAQCVVSTQDGFVCIIARNGRILRELAAPYLVNPIVSDATTVKLQQGKPDYFAVLTTPGSSKRSILYVFDSTGNLVYQEVRPDMTSSLICGPLGKSGREALYVGGQGQVTRYIAP